MQKTWIQAVLVVFLLLLLQPYKIGFEPGHHGWVTSQHLGIIQNAGINNYLVGYTGRYLHSDGWLEHFYFNKAPFPFEAISHYLLWPFRDNLALYGYAAAQLFNAIFLLTLLFVYLGFYTISKNKILSAFPALLVGSGFYWMDYKNLVEQNRLGTLAFAILFYAIAKFKKDKSRKSLFFWIFVASLMGEAAPSVFFIITWFLVFSVETLQKDRSISGMKKIIFSTQSAAGFFSTAIVLAFLAWNVFGESRVRDIPLSETGIVGSALKRLGATDISKAEEYSYTNYVKRQGERLFRAATPHLFYQTHERKDPGASGAMYIIFLLSFVIWQRKQITTFWKNQEDKDILIVFALSGIVYMTAMKNLTIFHDFTYTYSIGMYSVFYYLLAGTAKKPSESKIFLFFAITIFVGSLITHNIHHNRIGREVNTETRSVQKLKQHLPEKDAILYFDGGDYNFFPGAPHAPLFYFQEHITAKEPIDSQFVITRSPKFKEFSIADKTLPFYLIPTKEFMDITNEK